MGFIDGNNDDGYCMDCGTFVKTPHGGKCGSCHKKFWDHARIVVLASKARTDANYAKQQAEIRAVEESLANNGN